MSLSFTFSQVLFSLRGTSIIPARSSLISVSKSVTPLHSAPRIFSTMSAPTGVPYASQDIQEVQTLLYGLEQGTKGGRGAKKKTFSCKSTSFNVADSPSKLAVTSWRFQDWDYKRDDLPTYARGLFTGKNERGQPEISVRGYDKFHNVDETSATKWNNIEKNTKGPYELSLKENGCIIFLSGLHDGTLLVCSKHSTGIRTDGVSHAKAAEKWVDKHLATVGKTRKDLAKDLRRRNATAVAELCDDEFEEHILAYGKDDAGLYMHGVNINLPEFMTYSGAQVQDFAEEWGFRKTDFLVKEDIKSTKAFLDEVAETGHYDGRDVEGFVIRCKSRVASGGPYSDWFFKYKFEEPYLMYRQWRECTKAMISGRPPRFKKHVKITEEYLHYARTILAKNTQLKEQYQQNHGIIKLRDDFLKEKNLRGSDIIRQENEEEGGGSAPADVSKDIILVPIATLGCGKTTIALALVHLFGWGHIQNDNITGKGRPPRFTREVLYQLAEAPAVFADRNNALRSERQQLIDDVHTTHPHVRLVALNFVHSKDSVDKIREVTQKRVLSRGDNHQTIQAATDTNKVLGIMEGFIHRFQELDPYQAPDDGFDLVIDLDPTQDSRDNLETTVGQLYSKYPKLFTTMPSSDDLDEAIKVAMSEYKPDLRHEVGGSKKREKKQRPQQQQPKQQPIAIQKPRPVEYISVALPKQFTLDAVETAFASISSNKARFFKQLQDNRRVQADFHVTLIHRASSKSHPELWQRYCDMISSADPWDNKIGHCTVQLERIVWDDRVMAIVARLVSENWECVNEVAHVTVGTRSEDVKPKESNDLLKRWLEHGSSDDTGIGEVALQDRPVTDCTVNVVYSRSR